MLSQIHQVLRTYYTQWSFWLSVVFLLAMQYLSTVSSGCWPSVCEPARQFNRLSMMFGKPMLANLVMGMIVAGQLKRQFANPRSRLVPHFAAAHLLVAGAVLAAVIGVQSWVFLDDMWERFAWALICYAVLVIVVGSWCSYLARAQFVFLWFFGAMLAHQWAASRAAKLAIDGNTSVFMGMACLGLLLLAALGVRLLMLHEGMSEYSSQLPGSWWDLTDMTSRVGRRSRRQLDAQTVARSHISKWFGDAEFRLVFRWDANPGPLRRLLLRQLVDGFPGLIYASVLLVLLPVWLGFSRWRWPDLPFSTGNAIFQSVYFLFMTMMMFQGYWLQHWRYLARESLYPLSRIDFTRDLARSLAWDMAMVAVAWCVGGMAGLAIIRPQGPPTPLALCCFAFIIAGYAVAYCVLFWLASFRSREVCFLGIIAFNILSAVIIYQTVFAWKGFWTPATTALAVTATALTAAWLYRLAFRRWCNIDLD